MARVLTLFLAFACGFTALAAPVPRERVPPDAAAIKRRFYDCWHQVWTEERDANGWGTFKTEPSELWAYRFGEKGGRVWGWGGELSPADDYPVRIDTTRTPMRFERFTINGADGTTDCVSPGIFKFDGPRLILAYPKLGWQRWNANEEYANLPKDFEPRPGVVIAVLERCEHLEQYRPPERAPMRP